MMKVVLVAGATGAVGEQLVMQLLQHSQDVVVHLLSRRTTRWHQHPQIIEHILPLEQISRLQISQPLDAVFCCLGTTIKQAGSKQQFAAVDLEAVVALGRWSQQAQARQFHVISSLGSKPSAKGFYLKTKAEMELQLCRLQLPSLVIYQPSLLLADRYPRRFGESLAALISKGFTWLPGSKKWRPIPVEQVASSMLRHATSPTAGVQRLPSAQLW